MEAVNDPDELVVLFLLDPALAIFVHRAHEPHAILIGQPYAVVPANAFQRGKRAGLHRKSHKPLVRGVALRDAYKRNAGIVGEIAQNIPQGRPVEGEELGWLAPEPRSHAGPVLIIRVGSIGRRINDKRLLSSAQGTNANRSQRKGNRNPNWRDKGSH